MRAACLGPLESIRSSSGAPKAIVLPEPVGDLARTSRPSSTSAMTRDWMAKGASDAALRKGAHHDFGQAEFGK